jgi:hypothetical protein
MPDPLEAERNAAIAARRNRESAGVSEEEHDSALAARAGSSEVPPSTPDPAAEKAVDVPSGYEKHEGAGGWVYATKGTGANAEVLVLKRGAGSPRKGGEPFRVKSGSAAYRAIVGELFGPSEPGPMGDIPLAGGRPIPPAQHAIAEAKGITSPEERESVANMANMGETHPDHRGRVKPEPAPPPFGMPPARVTPGESEMVEYHADHSPGDESSSIERIASARKVDAEAEQARARKDAAAQAFARLVQEERAGLVDNEHMREGGAAFAAQGVDASRAAGRRMAEKRLETEDAMEGHDAGTSIVASMKEARKRAVAAAFKRFSEGGKDLVLRGADGAKLDARVERGMANSGPATADMPATLAARARESGAPLTDADLSSAERAFLASNVAAAKELIASKVLDAGARATTDAPLRDTDAPKE